MFKLKELTHIIVAIILFAFIISFLQGLNAFLLALIVAFVVVASNVIAKKISAFFLHSEIEQKILHFQRWGYYQRSQFKKPKPIGIILPFLLVWLSYPTGFIKMLTFLQMDTKTTVARAAKKRGGLYRYSEVTEWHHSLIPGVGIVTNLVIAIIAYNIGQPILLDIAKYSVYYAMWNILPIGKLDGTKIFFGSKLLWVILVIASLISLLFALILI